MLIYIGADHRGFKLKEKIKGFLEMKGYEVADLGNTKFDEADDYPDFAGAVAGRVSREYESSRGILICGSGAGVAIAANKFPRVRAALALTPDQAFDGRNDDDVNVLALAADYTEADLAEKIIMTWINAPFSGEERRRRRLGKIGEIEVKQKGEGA